MRLDKISVYCIQSGLDRYKRIQDKITVIMTKMHFFNFTSSYYYTIQIFLLPLELIGYILWLLIGARDDIRGLSSSHFMLSRAKRQHLSPQKAFSAVLSFSFRAKMPKIAATAVSTVTSLAVARLVLTFCIFFYAFCDF